MEKDDRSCKKPATPGLFSAIFPREYDFEAMLADQADRTVAGIGVLENWLRTDPLASPVVLERIEEEVDAMRHDMEKKLINSFSTPFDRQDIYSISRQMDYILNSSKDIAKEMFVFGVKPDPLILAMTRSLLSGTSSVAQAIKAMNSDRDKAEEMIRQGRQAYNAIEDMYITGMAGLFQTGDAMQAMKIREIYHHLRYAGRALRDTLDILHNAVIDLA